MAVLPTEGAYNTVIHTTTSAHRKAVYSECIVCLSSLHRISEYAEQRYACSNVNTSVPCLASGNFCHPWPLPHRSARGLQPLPGIWLSGLAAVQAVLLLATESGLVTPGPCCSFALRIDSLGPVLCIGTGSLPANGPSADLLAHSLMLERPERGPRASSGPLPQPFHCRALAQGCSGSLLSCESNLGPMVANEETQTRDLQSCSPGSLTALPVPE